MEYVTNVMRHYARNRVDLHIYGDFTPPYVEAQETDSSRCLVVIKSMAFVSRSSPSFS